MKIGFSIFPYDRFEDLRTLARVVSRADELGVDYVSFPEHVMPTPAVNTELANETWPDFTALAAYLAAETRRIEIVAGVYILPLCNPFRLARQLLTIDQLSNGRVTLGIGVGWNRQEFETMGVEWNDRAAITDEYATALKILWSEEPASFAGRHIAFDEVSCLPKPAGGSIRMLGGGAAARGPLERVARICDGWMPWKVTRDELPAALDRLSRLLEQNGRRLSDIDVTWGISLGSNSAARQARRHATTGDGDEEQDRAAESVASEIHELASLGVTMTSFSFAWETPGELLEALERFAAETMPEITSDRRPEKVRTGR